VAQTGETGSSVRAVRASKPVHGTRDRAPVTGTGKSICTSKASRVSTNCLSDYAGIMSRLWPSRPTERPSPQAAETTRSVCGMRKRAPASARCRGTGVVSRPSPGTTTAPSWLPGASIRQSGSGQWARLALFNAAGTQISEIFCFSILSTNFLPLPELLRVLTHLIANGRVFSVSWSPDGTKIASGSQDKTIKIWNAQTGQCVSTLSGHNDPVRSVCFSPCGTKIVSGGGTEESVGFSVGGNRDFSIRIWDAETGTQIGSSLSGHKGPVRSVCFSPCGTKIVSGGGEYRWTGNKDFSIRIWDAETGTQIGSPLSGHSGCVTAVSLILVFKTCGVC
jgi:WD40 repeat protein